MAYFTYTQKIWIMLILITLLFASLTNYPSTMLKAPDNSPTTSYLWLTICCEYRPIISLERSRIHFWNMTTLASDCFEMLVGRAGSKYTVGNFSRSGTEHEAGIGAQLNAAVAYAPAEIAGQIGRT